MNGHHAPAPPPGQWTEGYIHQSSSARPSAQNGTVRTDVDQANAWKHVKNVARDEGKSPDLYDLLSHSMRETQYSFQPQGWPSLLRPLSPIVSEMPAMVMDRYNACQTVAFCGVFPEIRRAWASVDNSLFLWRFDKWQDVPIEYSGEEQAIVAVGLANPRPGVFVEAIRHLLVVCTATEVALIGVCCSRGSGVSEDDCEEVTLQPLPLYSVPSDNVTMVSVVSTVSGRIFLGGADGHLYELQYAANDGWRTKRCAKVCHTGGLRQLLPSFLPGFLFGPPTALIDLKVDDYRHVLYARTQANGLQVFDLGSEGKDAPRKAAETNDLAAEASRAAGGREVFGRGAGDRKGSAVVFMSPIPPTDSARLHLLTVTADGRRVYWSVTSSRYYHPSVTGGGNSLGNTPGRGGSGSSSGVVNKFAPRPDRLRAEIARQAMPSPSSGGGRAAPSRGLQVSAAMYSNGMLVLAGGAEGERRTRVFLLSRDLTVPPVGTATGLHVAVQGLREAVTELSMAVPGEACVVRPAPPRLTLPLLGIAETSIRDELTAQNSAAAPRFVLVTTAGVLEVEKLRPTDVLAQLLEERNPSKLELFFKSYGAPESAAMCIQLAATGPPAASAAAVAAAKVALDDAKLCGEPGVRDGELATGGGNIASDDANGALVGGGGGGFDMGGAVPVSEPEWSGAHKGLCLYIARVLAPAWDAPIVVPTKGSKELVRCVFGVEDFQALEERLRRLEAFLAEYVARRKDRRVAYGSGGGGGTGIGGLSNVGAIGGVDGGLPAAKRQRLLDAHRQELARTTAIKSLVSRAADGCFLLRVLCEHNVGRIAARMDDTTRSNLKALRFRDWVSSDDGEVVATQLVSVLVSEHLSAGGEVADDLAVALQGGCPSYFREDDRLYYSASGLLRRAEGAGTVADREVLTRDAVNLMIRVPLACDLGQVVPQLALLRAMHAVVELPIKKAAALDPGNIASLEGPEGSTARARREESAYSHTTGVLRVLLDPLAPAVGPLEAFQKSLTAVDRLNLTAAILKTVGMCEDIHMQHAVFATLVDVGAIKELLQIDSQYLENYLINAGGLGQASSTAVAVGPLSPFQVACCEALARYYVQKERYAAAAGVHELLAARVAGPGEETLTLERRASHLQAAVLQARSVGDGALVDRLQAKLRLAGLQQHLVDELQRKIISTEQGPEREELEDALATLKTDLKELPDLYNDYAQRYSLWGTCLELVDVSNFRDAGYVRQLWDLYLKTLWEEGFQSASHEAAAERAVIAALESMSKGVETLGERFYPNEVSFPISHVLMRLEQAASGQWPQQTPGAAVSSRHAVRALVNVCGGSFDPVVRAYEALLSVRGSDAHGEELHSSFLRLQLLQSLKDTIEAGRDKLLDRAASATYGGQRTIRREVGVLTAACEAYAAEARRLPQQEQGERLGKEFETLQQSLQPLLGY